VRKIEEKTKINDLILFKYTTFYYGHLNLFLKNKKKLEGCGRLPYQIGKMIKNYIFG
jgi:hypothetical protein